MKYPGSHITSTTKRIANAMTLMITLLFLSGCAVGTSHRHHDYDAGASVSIKYHYYPDSHVYYDLHRHRYHYHNANRGWVSVKKLPKYIHLDRYRYHVVQTRHHKPWKVKHAHKKHRSHYKDQYSHRYH